MSSQMDDHDVLLSLGKDLNLRYNSVPDATALDVAKQSFFKIDWHHAHRLLDPGPWVRTVGGRFLLARVPIAIANEDRADVRFACV
ncbi:hypothetical protein V8E36_001485 [Tilletia maclaganii]